jgi:hypothetical protein
MSDILAHHGSLPGGILESYADIPSLSSAAIVAAVILFVNINGLVVEVDLASGISLSGRDVGSSYWCDDLSG